MLRMVEVIGTSPDGYSEAVRTAVERLIESGEKLHFFEIVEQRGAVREGKLKEFQVKVRAAVEIT
jgi:flavin-binding protein dodecin